MRDDSIQPDSYPTYQVKGVCVALVMSLPLSLSGDAVQQTAVDSVYYTCSQLVNRPVTLLSVLVFQGEWGRITNGIAGGGGRNCRNSVKGGRGFQF